MSNVQIEKILVRNKKKACKQQPGKKNSMRGKKLEGTSFPPVKL